MTAVVPVVVVVAMLMTPVLRIRIVATVGRLAMPIAAGKAMAAVAVAVVAAAVVAVAAVVVAVIESMRDIAPDYWFRLWLQKAIV